MNDGNRKAAAEIVALHTPGIFGSFKRQEERMDPKFEPLFTPWKIGNVTIKNRIVMLPMEGTNMILRESNGFAGLSSCGVSDGRPASFFLANAAGFRTKGRLTEVGMSGIM